MIIQLNSSIQASPNPQEIISKQSIDVFWNRNFSAVLLFVLGILAVAVSSIVFLRQKKLSRQSRSVA
jgi:LPS O-antigen subunit length determinant protein (WzzB/FepE family)